MTFAISTTERDISRGAPLPMRRQSAVATYLQDLETGLVILERDGRVALCSAKARRMLGLGPSVVGRSLRGLLAALGPDGAERGVALMGLRGPLGRGGTVSLEVPVGGVPLHVTVEPLSGAGWAVTLEEADSRTRPLEGGPDGASDPLTALPNRTRFLSRLEEARASLARGSRGFAVLAIDLDRFKQVNDTLGHPVGDTLLRKVAERLTSTLRPNDVAARFGGDEFAVLQAGVSEPAEAEALARRIVDLLGRAYVVEGHLVNVGASVGVALAPADGTAADALLRGADLALYRAKTDGRSVFRFFEPEMDARMRARRALELDLRRALALGEFELAYQPQMNLTTDRLSGCEALIRWRSPTRGLVSPADFIPLAEEIGLIVPIGEWVVRTACREAAR